MPRISPIKILAGILAVALAFGVMFYTSEARQATANILSTKRVNPNASAASAGQQADVGARRSGTAVIPVGVVSRPASGASHQ